jgi:hypothetical protein
MEVGIHYQDLIRQEGSLSNDDLLSASDVDTLIDEAIVPEIDCRARRAIKFNGKSRRGAYRNILADRKVSATMNYAGSRDIKLRR